ncbi:MAG: hypothetical protein WD875_16015, partial [Pirellulales bacterium]
LSVRVAVVGEHAQRNADESSCGAGLGLALVRQIVGHHGGSVIAATVSGRLPNPLDLPGRQSMKVNYELLANGLHIERVFILGWNLWPPEARLPARSIRQWIEDQHFRGIEVRLVRENDLVGEPGLLRDFGIYGDRATGAQETDADSRTVQFVLCFDQASIRLAQDRWERLMLYARPFGELLDHGLSIV